MEIEDLERMIGEGFIPCDKALELAVDRRLDIMSKDSIGIEYEGTKYWFRAIEGGLELYTNYEAK